MQLTSRKLAVLSAVLVSSYVIRITMLGLYMPQSVSEYSAYVILICVFSLLVHQSNIRINNASLLMVVSVSVSTLVSDYLNISIISTLLWLLVFAVVGPLFNNERINIFRRYLWLHSNYLIVAVTMLSFIWNSFGLPQYEDARGTGGITLHCMLMGAFAGLASVLTFNKLLISRSIPYFGLFSASVLTCLVSGSRSSVIASVLGMAVAIFVKFRRSSRYILGVGILLTTTFIWVISNLGTSDGFDFTDTATRNSYTAELMQKGDINSRELLWSQRWAEFESNPLVGVGIGVDTLFVLVPELTSAKALEPGSSYLAVLSMTGIFGAVTLVYLLFSLVYQTVKRKTLIPEQLFIQVASIGAFWTMHGLAEGWIFAGGSVLCLFFWIWVGRLASLGTGGYKIMSSYP